MTSTEFMQGKIYLTLKSGEELSHYRRLLAECIKTFAGGYEAYKMLLHQIKTYRGDGISAVLFYDGKAAEAVSLVVEAGKIHQKMGSIYPARILPQWELRN